MGFPLAAVVGGAILGGLFGRKKKKKPKEVYPKLEVPYLSEQQIQANPITQAIYSAMQGLPATLTQYLRPGMLESPLWATYYEAMRSPNIWGATATLHQHMRPAFELQLGEALDTLHERLARTLGTPRGGALGELLRRQAREMETQYMAQTAPMLFQELQAQREMVQRARQMLPALMMQQAQMAMFPTQAQMALAEMLKGTFVAPQLVQEQYAPSPFTQAVAALAPLILTGGISF
ncbi:MAG: hypothetical protein QXI60_08750 [Thermofilaceae archaeon]